MILERLGFVCWMFRFFFSFLLILISVVDVWLLVCWFSRRWCRVGVGLVFVWVGGFLLFLWGRLVKFCMNCVIFSCWV